MQKARESNFDLLRIVSTFSVVILHMSGKVLQINAMRVPENCHFLTMLLITITRFAVPCFFMLSGAFILAEERNADFKYFYKKSFKNVGIPSIVFCLLYMILRIARLIIGVIVFKRHDADYILPNFVNIIKSSIIGWPFDHLWYLFTLEGLYLAVPFVIRLAANLRGGG